MLGKYQITGCIFIFILIVLFISPVAAGEEPFGADITTGEMADIVVVGKGASYTTILPRDLILRPNTESLGLGTATSVIGRKEIRQTSC